VSFCIAGGIGAFIELVFFNIFFLFLAFPLSKLFALIIALSINFNINRNFTFSAQSEKRKKQIPKYLIVYSFAILINYLSSLLANYLLGNGILYANISAIIGILIGIPITFLGSLFWVFKIRKTQQQ
jgi:putative flippase GtrA